MKINVYLKVSDMFSCDIENSQGETVVSDYTDYVPDFMPGQHYGDYVELEIEVATGKILNWRPNAISLVNQFIQDQNNDPK